MYGTIEKNKVALASLSLGQEDLIMVSNTNEGKSSDYMREFQLGDPLLIWTFGIWGSLWRINQPKIDRNCTWILLGVAHVGSKVGEVTINNKWVFSA